MLFNRSIITGQSDVASGRLIQPFSQIARSEDVPPRTRQPYGNLGAVFDAYLKILAAVYLYGAIVHVRNITGSSGRQWADTPVHWRVADVFYLAIDLVAAVGLWLGAAWGIVAFVVAAGSQIVLYTLAPERFSTNDEERGMLRGLVGFHIVTIAILVGLSFT